MNYNSDYQNKDDAYYSHSRTELLPFVDLRHGRILDVGCGTGGFGSLLKKTFNLTVWGIEPKEHAAKEASKKLDYVIQDLFTEDLQQLKNQKFDLIFFNDVLEHLEHPEKALQACRKLLSENGKIIASIPNVRWYPVIVSLLRYKDFRYQEAGVMDRTHIKFFTSKSMVRLFQESGFNVEKIKGINGNKNFWVFNIINFLLLGSQSDMRYPQFVIVAGL